MTNINLRTATASAAAILTLTCGAASAASLDVSGFPNGYYGNTVAHAPEATITSFGVDLYFGGADGRPNSFCAVAGGSCNADMEIDFNDLVENLTFTIGGFDPGDTIEVFAYNAVNALLGSVSRASDGLVDMSAFSPISRIFIDDSSSGAGFGYDEFTWDVADARIPLPAALPLLAGALGALTLMRRRRS